VTYQELLAEAISTGAFTGAQLTVFRHGQLEVNDSFGYTDNSSSVPVVGSTLFDYASVTKPFVALAMMSAASEKGFDIGTELSQVVPELGDSVHGGLSFAQLLAHTTGQPRRFSRVVEAEAAFVMRDEPVLRRLDATVYEERVGRLLEDLRTVDLLFQPGTRVAYTSIGYFLLGIAAERLCGEPLDQVLHERILGPLGLDSVSYRPLDRVPDPLAYSATETCPWRGRMLRGEVHDEIAGFLGGVTGHAGLFGTSLDLASFGLAVAQHSLPSMPRAVLKATIQNRTGHLEGENRGWGWLLNTPGGYMGNLATSSAYGHTGFTGTSLLIDPGNKVVIALLTNRVHPSRADNRLMPIRKALHDWVITAVA